MPRTLTPLGPDGIRRLRCIMSTHQYDHVCGKMVDAYTASVIIQVYDRVKPEHKARLELLSISKAAEVCFAVSAV